MRGGKNEIIPERRRKYLGGGSDDNYMGTGGATSVGQQMMGIDSTELTDEKTVHKKNNKLNVHLQPLDHNPHGRGGSVPPLN